jgi:integrase/recombinase XerD
VSAALVPGRPNRQIQLNLNALPTLDTREGEHAGRRFVEFFTANIRNKNTRMAYMRALRPFLNWCEGRGLSLGEVQPVHVAAYIEQHPGSKPTVKQHLARPDVVRLAHHWPSRAQQPGLLGAGTEVRSQKG